MGFSPLAHVARGVFIFVARVSELIYDNPCPPTNP